MKKPRLTKKRMEGLQKQVFQYEVTLTKILPRAITHHWETLTEEIGILLFQRECLQEEFKQYGTEGKLASLWQRVQELDKILTEQRWMILNHARDYYERERERLKVPREFWWWYLDELEKVELPEWVISNCAE